MRSFLLSKLAAVSAAILSFISLTNQANAQYCPVVGSCGDYFTRITMGSVNKSGDAASCQASGGYIYYDQDTIYLQPGDALPYEIAADVFADTKVNVYLDSNMNGDWETPDEVFYTVSPQVLVLHEGVISVSPTQPLGNSRLRIVIYTVLDAPGDPCLTSAFQIIDFPVKYTDNPPVGGGSYCTGTGNCSGGYFISKVAVTGDNSTSINNSSSCDNYGDYTAKKVTMTAGGNYNVEIIATQNMYYGVAAVYVDWNDDKVFGNEEMSVGVKKTDFSGYDATVIVPDSMTTGFKRMRVRNTMLLGTPDACGDLANGEVEDYTVYYVNPDKPIPVCVSNPSPANAKPNVCQDLTLSWAADPEATAYRVGLSQAGTVIFKDSIVSGTSVKVPVKLQPGLIYKWMVLPFNANGFALGCDSLFFTTSPNGDPEADPQPQNVSICVGEKLTLYGNPFGGTSPYTHNWSDADGNSPVANLHAINKDTAVYIATAAGQDFYIYTVTDVNGCKGTGSIGVSVNAVPNNSTLSATQLLICEGATDTLIFTPVPTDVFYLEDSTATHSWSGTGADVISSGKYETDPITQKTAFRAVFTNMACTTKTNVIIVDVRLKPATPVVTVSPGLFLCDGDQAILSTVSSDAIKWSTGSTNDTIIVTSDNNYRVTVTDANGCSSISDPFVLNFRPRPATPVISSTGVPPCDGNTVVLNASGTDPINWDDANSTAGPQLSVTTTGTYTATAIGGNGCTSSSAPYTVTFKPQPTAPTVTVTGNNPACIGETVKLTANTSLTVKWDDPNNTSGKVLNVIADGAYSATVTDANGCTNSSVPQQITFNPLPAKPVITSIGNTPTCAGDSVILSSSYPTDNKWSTGSVNDQIVVKTAGSFTVTYTDANGCKSTSDASTITFGARPPKPSITQSSNTMTATTTAASYQWFDANGPIAGATSRTYNPSSSGFYRVVSYGANGCSSDTSAKFNFAGVGILELDNSVVTIYPNPAYDLLSIDLNGKDRAEVIVYNVFGQQVIIAECIAGKNTLQVDQLVAGTYFVKISTDEAQLVRPVVISR